jgi:hypothetical protein
MIFKLLSFVGVRSYYFYERKPLSGYDAETRETIRALYRRHGWNTDDGSVESVMTFFGTERKAKRIADREGLSFQELPINKPLPRQTCKFGLNYVPSCDQPRQTTEREMSFDAIPNRQTRRIQCKLERTRRRVTAAR